jgi:gamma-glutamyltranspeptidase/glutathione hydrolase
MAPTIILKDGEPFMVLGSCGGPKIISSVIAVINNVIDYGMNLQDAVDAPRFHAKDGEIDLDPAIPAKSLKDVGHKVLQRDEWWYFGAVQAVMFDNRTSAMYGVADPRRDGDAEGF